jgi:hypothetical protein
MMNGKGRITGDEGVSESIGFLLIFTMVIVGIGLVTLYGYPLLLQQQTSADEQIMEKNMVVLQNDMKSLAYKTVPYKETSMRIGGGALTVHNNVTFGPEFTISDGVNPPYLTDYSTGELWYRSDTSQQEISIQNGAVIKRNVLNSGSVMLAEPRWYYDGQTKTMVIHVICINSSELMSQAGIGTVQMELGETDYQYYPGLSSPVSVIYDPDPKTPDYSTAWRNYLTNKMEMNCPAGNPLTCTTSGTVNTLVIKITHVIIKSV